MSIQTHGIVLAIVFVACFSLVPAVAQQDRDEDKAPTSAAAEAAEAAEPKMVPPEVILDTQVPPTYPPSALAARYSGSVMLETKVMKDGRVGEVKVVDCTRPKVGFEEAAVDAVKRWRFVPGRLGEEPVEVTLKFRLNFRPEGIALASGDNPLSPGGSATDLSNSRRVSSPSGSPK